MINVLILSAGTRNKIVNYFVKELAGRGNVVATDMSSLALLCMKRINIILFPE